VDWLAGLAITTRSVRTRHWNMLRRERCIIHPSRMGPSRQHGDGS